LLYSFPEGSTNVTVARLEWELISSKAVLPSPGPTSSIEAGVKRLFRITELTAEDAAVA
jgi:hypothetical protein